MTPVHITPTAIPLLPTPQELIAGGLYKDLAKSCFPGHHRKARALSPTASSTPHRAFREEGRPCPQVSLVLLAKSLGATPARADLRVSGSIAEAGDLISGGIGEGSTNLAKRSLGGLSRVFAKMSSRSSAEAREVSAGEASSLQQQV